MSRRRACSLALLAAGLLPMASTMAVEPVMQRVPDKLAKCAASQQDGYCYEWRFVREPSLRLVAEGFEDGGSWTLYRVDGGGRYRRLLDIRPALQDDSRPGQLFWGYAWDITDAVAAPDRKVLRLSVSFQTAAVEAQDPPPPDGQKQLPHLLLRGTTTQPNILIPGPLRFEALTADQARVRARQSGTEVIDGTRAAVVAFAPTDTLGARDEGSIEGVAHTQFALQDTQRCLGPREIDYRFIFTDRLKVSGGSAQANYRGHQLGQGFGAVLVRPGRPPQLVVSREGPGTLLELLPEAAAQLWQEPACQPHP